MDEEMSCRKLRTQVILAIVRQTIQTLSKGEGQGS